MSLTRLHFDTEVEIGQTIRKTKRVKIELVYLGQNTYNVKAIDLTAKDLKDPKAIICNKRVEYPMLKGNTRKSFAKLRDFTLNVVEDRPEGYHRNSN